jgi:hypothetical protein
MTSVEIYIKKNTIVKTGVGLINSSPYTTINPQLTMIADQYKGFYIKITSGISINKESLILSNTTSQLNIETPLQIDNDNYEIFRSDFKRIDLFKEEKISLSSSIQNINDLSKVFTDFTQSFNIPASKNNNQIFSYWNESAVENGFDQRIRYDAIIELNTIPFKKGQIQIEKANEKNNQIESYSITFYGKVKQIKDLFKEDKLSVLDYSSLNHTYDFGTIADKIGGAADDDGVCYPLIGNKHYYEYNNGGTYDITIGSSLDTSIVYTDLFPAIPVSKVLYFIQNKYGITFTSTFFNTSYWKDLYLYCKNNDTFVNYTTPTIINWTNKDGVYPTFDTFPELDLINDTYTLNWIYYTGSSGPYNARWQKTEIIITPTDFTINYRLIVRIYDNPNYNNGAIYNIFDNLIGVQDVTVFELWIENTISGKFKFEIESQLPIVYSVRLKSTKKSFEWPNVTKYANAYTQNTSSIINISKYIPDIKVVDFFNGIIKMFNLTIIPTSETSFNLEPLEFFYSYGKYIDINSYVINDSVDIERTKLYKKLLFSHEKSENVLNNYFNTNFQRGYDYGDLLYENTLSNESATYEIKTPFEDVMWERKTNSNFQSATLIDKNLKPYKIKPILMYRNNKNYTITSVSPNIKLYNPDSGGYIDFNGYVRFSNELFLNNDIASINFGEEQSSWNLSALSSDSLFALWYRNYISALYDKKCRIVKLKAIIPIPMLTGIKLNDKIIYKDKKYIINQFTTDLTTGEVDFELISDFRQIASNGTDKFALKSLFNIDNTAQDLEVTILKLNAEKFDVEYSPTSYLNRDNYTDGTFIVPIDANTTGDIAYKRIEIIYHNPGLKQYINIIQNA